MKPTDKRVACALCAHGSTGAGDDGIGKNRFALNAPRGGVRCEVCGRVIHERDAMVVLPWGSSRDVKTMTEIELAREWREVLRSTARDGDEARLDDPRTIRATAIASGILRRWRVAIGGWDGATKILRDLVGGLLAHTLVGQESTLDDAINEAEMQNERDREEGENRARRTKSEGGGGAAPQA